MMFLYTNNEHMDPEIKNTISFIMAQKMKYFDVNIKKHTQDGYVKNCEIVILKKSKNT